SFSVRDDGAALEYQSNALLAQRRNAVRPGFWRMLVDIVRFNRNAAAALQPDARQGVENSAVDSAMTVGEFLRQGRYGAAFRRHYLLPMTAAIWSAPPRSIEDFPARFLLQFLANHGLLTVWRRPQWLTIPGGSRRYVAALAAGLADRVRLACPVRSVRRVASGVVVDAGDLPAERFDVAVLATHAPQSLQLLVDASLLEQRVLGAFRYQRNDAVLHTDPGFLPRRRRAWASWNCHVDADPCQPIAVTYDLNRLQRLGLPGPLCVTLNPPRAVAPNRLIRTLQFEHPLFDAHTADAQQQRDQLHKEGRVYFCGAYWGYGFHEDGVNSALAVARELGVDLDALSPPLLPCTVASTSDESLMCGASR
ncbi:MAG TPA: FAD-dependent oxidoreductase, partial [Lacipirellulaceae bacterium]|nr:FAD-dependent oxidoreductase [Lacipirellulaceae bacterium]